MDIFGIIGNFLVNQVYGVAVGIVTTTFAVPALKIGVSKLFQLAENPLAAWLVKTVGGEKDLARFIVEYVERKIPDKLGKEKKEEAARIITKQLPFLPQSFTSELIELVVDEMNKSLKNTSKKIS